MLIVLGQVPETTVGDTASSLIGGDMRFIVFELYIEVSQTYACLFLPGVD